jgi:hypothetical protein
LVASPGVSVVCACVAFSLEEFDDVKKRIELAPDLKAPTKAIVDALAKRYVDHNMFTHECPEARS